MPLTLADYARYCSDFPSGPPSLGRTQRVLCRLGVHRWHRWYHKQGFMQRFLDATPLSDLPFRKIDSATYDYEVD